MPHVQQAHVQQAHLLPLGPLAGWQLASLPNLATILVLVPVLYVAAVATYRLWFHPLAKFPGPRLLAATGMPYLYLNSVKGTFAWRVKDLHRKYGPVVRIAPNRLAVDGSVGWSDVFMHRPGKGTAEFGKQNEFFGPESEKGLIGAPTRDAHRRQRRQLSHAFSEAAMHEQEPLISFYIDLFIQRLSENARGGKSIDMLRWLNYLTFDIIGDLALGESFGSLATSDYHPWVHNIFKGIKGLGMVRFFVEAGPLLAPLALLDPNGLIKANKDNRRYAYEKALARIDLGPEPPVRASAVGADGQPKVQVRRDFMTYMMRTNKDGENGLSRDEMRVNANTVIVAGSETTGTNLSTLFFELARPRHRHYRDAVAAEVRGQFKRESDVTLLSVQNNRLPLLHACIEECLRIHPPAAETPPRVSPGALVNGQYVPKGTIISLYQLATYHNPDNFLEPEKFQPERFLPADHPMYDPRFKAHDNMAAFKPFSAGPRDCIGKNLAYSEMRLVAARVLLRFDIELGQGTNDNWLDNHGVFIVYDKPPLMLKLTERTDLELKDQ